MECKPPPEILQLKAVCITLPFVLCTKTLGPPRRTRGLPFLYLYDKRYAHMCALLLFPPSTGSTSRPGGLPPSTICRLL